jgi:serine protease inhibitor
MKIIKKALLGLGLTTVLLACDGLSPAPAEELKTIGTNFSDVSTAFSLDLWKKIEQTEKDKNYFVSPLSLHTALGMLLNGADGNTAAEIKTALKLNNLDAAKINDTYAKIMANFSKIDPKVTAKMANSVWFRKDFPIAQSYLDQNKSVFLASSNSEDFSAATVKKMNQWASDNTEKKIEKVIDEIKAEDVLFLMNALYFKGDWKIPFDSKKTQTEAFMSNPLFKKSVPMMNIEDSFGYVSNSVFSALELPYGSDKFNMTLILPANTQTSISSLINALSTKDWTLINTMPKQKVMVKLPKFTLSYEIKLNQILQSMGMKEAFGTANFSKMVSDQAFAKKLSVSMVKQNTFIGVDEKGTEAAAVTTIGVSVTSAGPATPAFFCNRPFLFVIHEKTSGQIMFIGKIANL